MFSWAAVVIVVAVEIGDGRVHIATQEPSTSYVESLLFGLYLSRVRNSRLAGLGKTSDSSGKRSRPVGLCALS